jgi:hypothetical protein
MLAAATTKKGPGKGAGFGSEETSHDALGENACWIAEDAQDAAQSFLQRNLEEALANFGSSADNMTVVLCYCLPQIIP